MKNIFRIIILSIVITTSRSVKWQEVSRRSLADMAEMVRVRTGKDALDFNDYGNYCGLGGGGEPVDGIDRCCAVHDRCYNYLVRNECFPYLVGYKYNILGSEVQCFFTGDFCSDVTCTCDKDLADCVSQFPYNPQNKQVLTAGRFVERLLSFNTN